MTKEQQDIEREQKIQNLLRFARASGVVAVICFVVGIVDQSAWTIGSGFMALVSTALFAWAANELVNERENEAE